jgi:archaetidylinositol phosphate synthase
MSATSTFQPAVRIQTSILADLERKALVFLAGHLPAGVNSDHLTIVGALAMAGVGAAFWIAGAHPLGLIAVPILLSLNWFGDSLDGTLARVRRQERPRYGYYVDHVLDAAGMAFLTAGLILGGHMSPVAGLAFLSAYYLLTIEIALAAHARQEFRMAFWRIGPTELRIVLAIGALMRLRSPTVSPFGAPWLLFDVGAWVALAGLVVTFIVSAVVNTRALYREESLRAL